MREGISQQTRLAVMQFAKVFRVELPSQFRMSGKRARAGAGNVNQNTIESPVEGWFEWKRLPAVQNDYLHVSNAGKFQSLPHGAHTMLVEIHGDYAALCSGSSRQEQGLAARRGA